MRVGDAPGRRLQQAALRLDGIPQTVEVAGRAPGSEPVTFGLGLAMACLCLLELRRDKKQVKLRAEDAWRSGSHSGTDSRTRSILLDGLLPAGVISSSGGRGEPTGSETPSPDDRAGSSNPARFRPLM